jgi:hypothetical protein
MLIVPWLLPKAVDFHTVVHLKRLSWTSRVSSLLENVFAHKRFRFKYKYYATRHRYLGIMTHQKMK